MTGLTLVLLLLFASLGRWQWERGEYKQTLRQQFEQGAQATTALGARPTADLPRFAQVMVRGRWDASRQFLLDNRTRDGQAGYEVLTPLRLQDGRWLLVNRGWLPFQGYRERLPDVSLPTTSTVAEVAVTGRLDELPGAALESGRAPPATAGSWPRVTSFPTTAELAAALGVARLEPRLLLLDPAAPDGYRRDWQPPGMAAEKHWSYAIQWWSFAVVLVLLYGLLNTRKIKDAS
jgi:surfeit locus 1 family protein